LDRIKGLTEELIGGIVFRLRLEFVSVFGEVSFNFNLFGLIVDLVKLLYKILLCNRRQLYASKLCVNYWDCVSQLQQNLNCLNLLCFPSLFRLVFSSETEKKFGALDVAGCPKIGIDRFTLDQAHQHVSLCFSIGMSFKTLLGFQCESEEANVFHKSFNIIGELLS